MTSNTSVVVPSQTLVEEPNPTVVEELSPTAWLDNHEKEETRAPEFPLEPTSPQDSVEDITSPRSKTAAVALEGFKKASGMRKLKAKIVQFMDEEPDKQKEPMLHLRWRLACFMESPGVRIFFISLVVLNSIMMGVQADHNSDADAWIYLELIFVSLFVLELAGKMLGFGFIFWFEAWNVLDFVIIGLCSAELLYVLVVVEGAGETSAMSTVRLVRVFRIVRMMSVLDRLNMLVKAFLLACQDIVWVGLLMLIILYIFAILAQGFFRTQTLKDAGFEVDSHFGTIPKTMFTLFQVMTMDSWYSGITRPIGEVYEGSQLFFVFFTLVASFGVLNLLTAIFIDSLNVLNKEGAIEEQEMKQDAKKLLFALMRKVFEEQDRDKGGDLDRAEMKMALATFQTQEYIQAFASVGLDLAMIESMLKHADSDMNGRINWEEFTDGIQDMDDELTKSDMWVVDGKINRMQSQLAQQAEQIADQQAMLRQQDYQMTSLHEKLDLLLSRQS